MNTGVVVLAGLCAVVLAGGPAGAAMTILGGGMAQECSKAALAGKSDADAVSDCTIALESEALGPDDRAGTLINRGVMRLRLGDFEAAHADFNASIALAPNIGEGWVNRGAMFVGERNYRAGLDDINHGLQLGAKEPEKAYFNRALAYEGLDDEKSAYLDYQQALTLKPGWALPLHELLRFNVTRR